MPATVPDVGAILSHAGHDWLVASIENEDEGITVAVLNRSPEVAEPTDRAADPPCPDRSGREH
jgi:hypothetical protein